MLERGAGQELVHSPTAVAHNGDWQPILKIHKRADGKFIKSPTYSPADLRLVIDEQIRQAKS